LHAWVALAMRHGEPSLKERSLKQLLRALSESGSGFRCSKCAAVQPDIFWRCASCHAWDTVQVAWGRRCGEEAA
jgi:lipopolysaccharide biosynthesis regulator YciM